MSYAWMPIATDIADALISHSSVTAVSRHQRWNWVTFCDTVTRESSDPETQLTRWPCSIMNSKCRRSIQAKEFLIIIGKRKSSLHGLTSSDFSPATDTWQWLLSFQHFKCYVLHFGHFFRKPEKLGSHTGPKWWPGNPDVKDDPNDPLTRW